jgi:signal transduction histidine kinase
MRTPENVEPPVKARIARRVVWLLWAGIVGLSGAGFVLTLSNRSVINGGDLTVTVGMCLAAVGYGTVGTLIAARRQNRIGWIFITIALGFGLYAFSWAYVVHGLVTSPGSLRGTTYLAWERSWVLTFAFAPIPLLLLLFPTGRVPSRRWRPVAWILIAGPALNAIAVAFQPGILFEQHGVRVENPFGISGFGQGPWLAFIVPALVWMGAAVSSLVALVQRFRRAAGEERQQLKWLAYVAGIAGVMMLPGILLGSLGVAQTLSIGSLLLFVFILFIGIPVASGIAILKYRLYDLDVVVKKTVAFGVLAVLVSVLYVAVLVGIGLFFKGSEASPATALTYVAAAILALAFQPIRRRANHLANRLVYGRRATPYEVLSEFSDRMTTGYSAEEMLPRMAQILAAGTGARRGQVWLRVGTELRVVASWPPGDGLGIEPLRLSGEELPDVPGASGAFPVRHQGELLGAITVAMPASDPLTPSKEKLIQHLAGQAGLVLRNVRLIEELRASRQRIVTAQDARAKALERNIHDGAQQQLVALMVKLRLAEQLADRDANRTKEFLRDLQSETNEALENLRELARGIYPPLLADRGLAAAIASQARRAAVPIDVDGDGIGRYPPEAESAVYFCCLEALQNVAKYAGASRAAIRLYVEGDRLVFQVEDDGVGFDVVATSYGSGIQNMSDRVAALGGNVKILSTPGRGTTVTGRIPVARVDHV